MEQRFKMFASRFWWSMVFVDLVVLAIVVYLLRNSFASQIGIGNRAFELSKPLMVIVLWLMIAVPMTACASVIRRFVYR